MLLNIQRVHDKPKREIKIFLKQTKMEIQYTKNIWDTAKVVLRGKFTLINAYVKKQNLSLTLHIKEL